MCNLHYETMLNISRKILKSLIVNVDFQSSNYCIPHRHRLLGQTTKQSLSNFESKKSWKYKQLQKLRPEHSCLWIKISVQQKCEKKYLQKKGKKGPASLLKNLTLGQFCFDLWKWITWFHHKQSIDSKWVIPNNWWIKKISELLQTVPLPILNFLLTIKVSYFLFYTYVKSLRSTMTWKENLPQSKRFFSLSFLSTSPAIRMPKWVMCGDNLTMKFPPDSHNYTELNGLWIASLDLPLLHQMNWF